MAFFFDAISTSGVGVSCQSGVDVPGVSNLSGHAIHLANLIPKNHMFVYSKCGF
jgi:hypothetical protein